MAATAPQPQAMTPAQQMAAAQALNNMRRHIILHGGISPENGVYYPPAVEMWQRLNPPAVTANPPLGTVWNVPFRNVGLIKRWILEIKATITAGATSQQNLTALGLANLINNITVTDFGNTQRIPNVPGWALNIIASAKRRRVFGAAITTDTPNGFGNNNNRVMFAPATIAPTVATEVDLQIEIPLCKDDIDLRGVLFASVNQAQGMLAFSLNSGAFVASTGDPTNAVYQSAGSDLATISNVSVQLTQIYLDQLPRWPQDQSPNAGAIMVPGEDISTAYNIQASASGVMVANVDNNFNFQNLRQFESVTFVYDNNGTLNVNASDLNYVRLTSANMLPILDLDPKMLCLRERQIFGDDPPKGVHYIDFRHRPIDTAQIGNMQLQINPSNVGGTNSIVNFIWESFGRIGITNLAAGMSSGAGG